MQYRIPSREALRSRERRLRSRIKQVKRETRVSERKNPDRKLRITKHVSGSGLLGPYRKGTRITRREWVAHQKNVLHHLYEKLDAVKWIRRAK